MEAGKKAGLKPILGKKLCAKSRTWFDVYDLLEYLGPLPDTRGTNNALVVAESETESRLAVSVPLDQYEAAY